MYPRERLLAAWRGEEVDRAPIVLPGIGWGDDPARRAVMDRVGDQLDMRVSVPSHISRMLVTPPQRTRAERTDLPDGMQRTHGVVDTPRGELTYVVDWDPVARTWWQIKYPVETGDDIEKIASVPWELPAPLESPKAAELPNGFERRGLLGTHISSPMVCVAGMMKYEYFLELCATDLDRARELTGICLERVLDCLAAVLDAHDLDYVWMGGSEWVTAPMASPTVYDALVQEQERRIIDYVHGHSNAIVHVHCHGRVRHALQRMVERGVDYTEPVEPPPDGDITMAEAKRLAGGRITLGGNVECRVLCRASEQEVAAATRAAFEGGTSRFVLRPTEAPSPRMGETELRNYMKMIDVWEELAPPQSCSSSSSSSSSTDEKE